ncbi:MAG TPA: hypothetical protein VKP65_18970 [Rhodothermales bacterium]|nr:hypothetical protein [Rhodothermales bacterium]
MPSFSAFLALAMLLLMGTCASTEDVQSINEQPGYLVEAATRYGDAAFIDTYENEAGTYVLVAHHLKPTTEQPLPMVSFFIYDLEADSVVFSETNIKGEVAWHDNRYVKVDVTPSVVPEPGNNEALPPVYFVDAYTGIRVTELE